MPIQTLNPATGKIEKKFKPFSATQVDRVLAEAQAAFLQWRQVPINERAKFMHRAAAVLRKNKARYGKLITIEVGKPLAQSIAEIEKCALACDYFADNAGRFLDIHDIPSEHQKSYVRFDPLGVVLAVMPWNFPFWQVFRFAAPSLMAGNVGVLKHASNVPQCTLAIEEVFRLAKFPKGVFRSLLLESKQVEALINDARVAAVTLTGSELAGSSVASAAGRQIKKSVLELGGSDAFIILKDADITQAAKSAVQSRTLNAGQSCIAAKRFIIEKSIADRFIKLFVQHMRALKVGDPLDEAVQVGPLARHDLRDELHKQVEQSVRKGAKVLVGGKMIAGPGAYYEPTVLVNVKPGMPAYDEELFGPVATILIARDAGDAVRLANDTRFGLGANLWTKDLAKAENLAEQIDAGAVFINDFVKSDPRFPFGGIKKSGYGRELGEFGIREFVNAKLVVVK